MALTLWNDPFMTEMDRTMNRMLNTFGMGSLFPTTTTRGTTGTDIFRPSTTGALGGTFNIPMDIVETANNFELHADTPGMTPEEIKVELDNGVLTVSGNRKVVREDTDAGGRVWRSERSSYGFSRSFTLPDNANPEGINATIDKGVLKVCIPKTETEKQMPKRITVKGGTTA
ncbi:Heat shock protein, chloroplastic [Tetrabaena socialis]|uniref:Heat shock protein, chloroplastic n=1 Tax=Tetrabaena socialis TaxID=47790 RepID=A0A2J8A7N9_9CHLO|nr:Heat shock protein, chloroplastic [Tetrabaena socialis]|eukprot:PNH08552.1 Heat shock protein, chloroplastic [Tetrabaena socialis]